MEKKWFQQPYVWMLISIPATSVVLSMVFLYLAINGRDPMVVDDYYKKGRAINEVLSRDKRAAELGLTAAMDINNRTNKILLEFRANNKLTLPEILELKITHATRGELDETVRLYRSQPGLYQGQLPAQGLQAGKWYLELGTKQWRVTKKITLPNEKKIMFQPGH